MITLMLFKNKKIIIITKYGNIELQNIVDVLTTYRERKRKMIVISKHITDMMDPIIEIFDTTTMEGTS